MLAHVTRRSAFNISVIMPPTCRASLIGFALACLAVPPAAAQQIVGERDARAIRADSVFQAFDRTDSPGCALGVFQKNNLLYARGYGMASLELGVAISPRTVFDVGSVSKQFTAMSILLLAKDGKLSIDESVRKYVPELPAYADRITLRHLLSHTSGLRDHFGLLEVAGRSFEGFADTVDYLRSITRQAETNFEPGARYLYSNTGFVLLSQIVYRVSGKPLSQFAAERIFQPLGMRDTWFQDDHTLVIPNRAEGYQPRGKGFGMRMSQWDGMAGAGGLHTSIEDFGRWLRNYDEATVGGHDVVTAMRTATRLRNDSLAASGPESAYGLGVNVGTFRGVPVISHGGVWAGYRAHFMKFSKPELAVVTFCNLTTSGPDSLTQKVAAIYLDKEIGPDLAGAWRTSLAGMPRADVAPAALRALTGVWRNIELGEVRRTEVVGDTLILQGGGRSVLVPLDGRRFRTTPMQEVRFEGDSAGVPTRLVVRTANLATMFNRVAAAPSASSLAEYAGEYYNSELDVMQVLAVENGKLVVRRGGRRLGVLEPTYRDGFVRAATVVDFTRNPKGKISGFVLEAGRVRHLRFVRAG